MMKYKIGSIIVDSSLIALVDPCQVLSEQNYESVIIKKFEERNAQFQKRFAGVLISTPLGDGEYPVYVIENEDGLVEKLVIEFNTTIESAIWEERCTRYISKINWCSFVKNVFGEVE